MAAVSGPPAGILKSTKDYLSEHQIEVVFKDILGSVLLNKPARPWDFMIGALHELQSKKEAGENVNTVDLFRDYAKRYNEKLKSDALTQSEKPSAPTAAAAAVAVVAVSESQAASPALHDAEHEPAEAEAEAEDSFDVDGTGGPNLSNRFVKTQQAAAYKRGRRCSVSGESVQPSEDNEEKIVIPKSNEARMRIASAISTNLVFRNLDSDQRKDIVDAMFERKVAAGEAIIRQGDEGDNFYVVDEGDFEVFVNGKKVVEIHAGGSFGELALMYNTPRAATVVAKVDSVLWAVDRVTFHRSVVNNTFRKRKLYEGFLKTVPVLKSLEPSELVKIADALEPIEFTDEEAIVEQGDSGDSFYLILSGEAIVTKVSEGETEAQEVLRLHAGDYFGEIALITEQPRAATVTAKGDVKCVCLDRKAFIRLLGPIMEILQRNMDNYKRFELMVTSKPTTQEEAEDKMEDDDDE